MKITKILGILLFMAIAMFAVQPYVLLNGSYISMPGVDVVSSATVAAKSVSLNKTTVTITKGKTFKLIAKVLPTNATDKKVTWKSSNVKIATVSVTGLVKAIAKGSATITVTTKSGSWKKTCKVTVK